MKRLAVAVAVCGIAPAALAPATSLAATPVPPRFAGINYAFYPNVQRDDALRMARGGVGSVRFGLEWYSVEAREGTYDWRNPDTTIGNLAATGIDPVPVLFGTPFWASNLILPPIPFPFPTLFEPGQGTTQPPTATEAGTQGWPRFVAAAVHRYGPHGTYWRGPYHADHPGAAPHPVRTWQVWNEPNIAIYFSPQPSVKEYADLLKISHSAIKGADPKAQIALGGLPCRVAYGCLAYLSDLYKIAGIRRTFDIVDIHPYGATVGDMMGQLRQARAEMDLNSDGDTPLWTGEFGWGSGTPASHYNRGEDGQAHLVSRAFRALRHQRRKLGLWRVSWFDWRDAPPQTPQNGCDWCGEAGLFRNDGTPKPSWRAYRTAVRAARGY